MCLAGLSIEEKHIPSFTKHNLVPWRCVVWAMETHQY